MGYPIDLDEIPTDKLEGELTRRRVCIKAGLCPYCGRKLAEHACKMKGRLQSVYKVEEIENANKEAG